MNDLEIDSELSGQIEALFRANGRARPRGRLRLLLLLLKARQLLRTIVILLRMSTPEVNENVPSFPDPEPASASSDQAPSIPSAERLRKKYLALLEGAPDAVFVADSATGKIIETNQTAASLLETSVDEIVGRHQSELHPAKEADKYRSFFERHQKEAENGPATFRSFDDGSSLCVATDTGKRVPVEISASFVDLNGEELFVGIFRDITERKERERELKKAKQEAEEASRLKSAMLANMSHEIRTPITSIIGFSKVLTQMLQGEAEEHAERIYQAGQHLMKTIHSILQLSKLESGVQDLEQRGISLNRVAEWAADLLAPQAREKNHSLEVNVPESPTVVLGNREALNRIAENLVENAIKFTPDGGRIEIRVREEKEEACLEIEDTGIGMDRDAELELFQAFKQGSGGLTREYEGSGLGLSIVRELTERLEGTIDVETQKGEGSCFTVRFPLHEDNAGPQKAP